MLGGRVSIRGFLAAHGRTGTVSKTVLYMSMSVDGFIAGPNVAKGNGLGDGGHRLHEWFLPDADAERRKGDHLTGVNREVMDEVSATGAVVVGRRTFELAAAGAATTTTACRSSC